MKDKKALKIIKGLKNHFVLQSNYDRAGDCRKIEVWLEDKIKAKACPALPEPDPDLIDTVDSFAI